MDLYTIKVLDTDALGASYGAYLPDTIIDEYQSLIWTERYLKEGEMQLVLPASIEMKNRLSPGVVMGMNSSDELMLIDTRSIKGNLMTVKGFTLEKFLNERYCPSFTVTDTPAYILGAVVQNMIDNQLPPDPGFPQDGTALPSFSVGTLENHAALTESEITTEQIQGGPTYDILLGLAQKFQLDFHVYRRPNATNTAWELHFEVREPKDHTTDQDYYNPIRFSPHLDTYDKVEEILSEVDYKSVVLARAPQTLSIGPVLPLKVSKVPNGTTEFQPFKERIIEIDCTDITEAMLPSSGTDAEKLTYLYNQLMRPRAKRELKRHLKTNHADGEVPPDAPFRYYADYNPDHRPTYHVGDIVETQGNYGGVSRGNISEHVRSFDSSGQLRSYPTVTQEAEPIIDPAVIAM